MNCQKYVKGVKRQHLREWSAVACVALACGAAIGAQNPTSAQGGVQTPSARCRISGRLTSGTAPLPGASIVVSLDNSPRAITSSDVDGTYVVQLSPGATYRLAADLAGFSAIERAIEVTAPPCDQTVDLQLALQPRRPAGQTPSSGPNAESTARRPPASTRTALPGIERSGRRGHVHYARDRSHASVRGRRAAASAGILRRGGAVRRDRDRRHQQRHQSRPRAAQRSTRRDHARPVRSGDRSVRAWLRTARWRRRSMPTAVAVPAMANSEGAAADRAAAVPDAVDQAADAATSFSAAAPGARRVPIRDRSTTRSADRSSTVRPINCARRFRSPSRSSRRTISARRSEVRSRSPASTPTPTVARRSR